MAVDVGSLKCASSQIALGHSHCLQCTGGLGHSIGVADLSAGEPAPPPQPVPPLSVLSSPSVLLLKPESLGVSSDLSLSSSHIQSTSEFLQLFPLKETIMAGGLLVIRPFFSSFIRPPPSMCSHTSLPAASGTGPSLSPFRPSRPAPPEELSLPSPPRWPLHICYVSEYVPAIQNFPLTTDFLTTHQSYFICHYVSFILL